MTEGPSIKLMGLHAAADGLDKAEFRQWFLSHHAPTVLEHSPQLRRYIVNLADVPTSHMNARRVKGFDREPAYDVITEMWFDEVEDFIEPARRSGSIELDRLIAADLINRTSSSFIYRVTELTEMDTAIGAAGGRTNGSKCISSATFLGHVDAVAGRQWWDKHARGTCENLPGLLRYRRNIVEDVLTPGAPSEFGIGELHYRSLFHAEHIPIQPDVTDYLDFDRTWNLDCSEYVLK